MQLSRLENLFVSIRLLLYIYFFLVKGNIQRQQSYPTPEVRPLQVFLTILTLQTPAKFELIKHKISALGG